MSREREGSGKRQWMTLEGWMEVGLRVEPVDSDSGEQPRNGKRD